MTTQSDELHGGANFEKTTSPAKLAGLRLRPMRCSASLRIATLRAKL